MPQPLVSIIIPCYKQAAYLPEAVASAVAQTYPCREIVIVDDGSPDETSAVARALIGRYDGEKIRLLVGPNSGLGSARNAGIRTAKGHYLVPLDADDTLSPDMLSRCVAALEQHPAAGFAYSDARFFGDDNRLYRAGPFDARRLPYNNYLLAHSLLRRTVWEQAGGYASRRALPGFEDWDLWLSALEAGWQGFYVAEPLVGYRRQGLTMLAGAYRRDLMLRARIILRHQRLYPRPLLAWAVPVATQPNPDSRAWLRAYLAYNALVARYAPRYLPKILARPFYARVSPRRQGQLSRLLRG
jgi:glycosyltransferase involved in cell wall biosynthesis